MFQYCSTLKSSSNNDKETHVYFQNCIHELTGLKPRLANHSDGKPCIWRE